MANFKIYSRAHGQKRPVIVNLDEVRAAEEVIDGSTGNVVGLRLKYAGLDEAIDVASDLQDFVLATNAQR